MATRFCPHLFLSMMGLAVPLNLEVSDTCIPQSRALLPGSLPFSCSIPGLGTQPISQTPATGLSSSAQESHSGRAAARRTEHRQCGPRAALCVAPVGQIRGPQNPKDPLRQEGVSVWGVRQLWVRFTPKIFKAGVSTAVLCSRSPDSIYSLSPSEEDRWDQWGGTGKEPPSGGLTLGSLGAKMKLALQSRQTLLLPPHQVAQRPGWEHSNAEQSFQSPTPDFLIFSFTTWF